MSTNDKSNFVYEAEAR